MAQKTPNFILLLVILIYTSPPIFIKIGPKLTKFAIGVVFGQVGRVVKIGPAPPSAHFMRIPPKLTSIPIFVKIGRKLWKLANHMRLVGGLLLLLGRHIVQIFSRTYSRLHILCSETSMILQLQCYNYHGESSFLSFDFLRRTSLFWAEEAQRYP